MRPFSALVHGVYGGHKRTCQHLLMWVLTFDHIYLSMFSNENGNSRSSRGCVQWVQLLKTYVHKKKGRFYSAEVVHSCLCTTQTYPVYILLTTCVQVQIYPIGYATLCTTSHLSTALCTVLLYLYHRPIFNKDRHVHRLRQLLKHRAVNLPTFLVRVWVDHVPQADMYPVSRRDLCDQ